MILEVKGKYAKSPIITHSLGRHGSHPLYYTDLILSHYGTVLFKNRYASLDRCNLTLGQRYMVVNYLKYPR